jgi:hypothetical protein
MCNRFGDNGFFLKHLTLRVPFHPFSYHLYPIPKGLHDKINFEYKIFVFISYPDRMTHIAFLCYGNHYVQPIR